MEDVEHKSEEWRGDDFYVVGFWLSRIVLFLSRESLPRWESYEISSTDL